MEIKPLAFATPLTPTADVASKPTKTGVTESDSSKSTLQQFSSENIGYAGTGANKPLCGHIVTDATSATLTPELTQENVIHALQQVVANLTLFFVPCDESNASKIFVLNEKRDVIELEENKPDPNFRDTHHEAAKAHFIANYEALYGKTVIDTFYPEELRNQPLTLGQAHRLREQLNEFQKSVEAACQGDPSKYDATLKAQLETLHQIEKAVDTAFQSESPLKAEVTSLEKYLSEQIGVSAETVHTCLLAGTAIAALAATPSGLALPAALHAAATAISSHTGVVSAAALTAKGTPLATSLTSNATAMSSTTALHNIAHFTTHTGANAAKIALETAAGGGAIAGAMGGFFVTRSNDEDDIASIFIPILEAIGRTAIGEVEATILLTEAPNQNRVAVIGGMVAGAVVSVAFMAENLCFGGLCSALAYLAAAAI